MANIIIQNRVLIVPSTIRKIEYEQFYKNKDFTSIYFEPRVNNLRLVIGKNAFYGGALTELTIPSFVSLIDEDAFSENKNLTSLIFEPRENNLSLLIKSGAFYSCDITGELIIHNFIIKNERSDNIFCYNKRLTSIVFEPRNDRLPFIIGDCEFGGCGIKEIIIPCFVTTIRDNAFIGNPLISIIFEPRIAYYEELIIDKSVFLSCILLEELIIPPFIKIKKHAFKECLNLSYVITPVLTDEKKEKIFGKDWNKIYFTEYYGIEHNTNRRIDMVLYLDRVKEIVSNMRKKNTIQSFITVAANAKKVWEMHIATFL